MPKIKRTDYAKVDVYEDEYVGMPYEHLVNLLHSEFGVPRHMIEYHPCAGDESLFLRFKGNSFWLFEIDEEQFFSSDEWNEHVMFRLNAVYTQMEKIMD